MEQDMEKLLIEIQKAVLCEYISDLHYAEVLSSANQKQRVLDIPDEWYSSAVWSEAASYITGKSATYGTVSEAKKAIIDR